MTPGDIIKVDYTSLNSDFIFTGSEWNCYNLVCFVQDEFIMCIAVEDNESCFTIYDTSKSVFTRIKVMFIITSEKVGWCFSATG